MNACAALWATARGVGGVLWRRVVRRHIVSSPLVPLAGFIRLSGSAACRERVSHLHRAALETVRTVLDQWVRLTCRPRFSERVAGLGGRVCTTARCVGFSCSPFVWVRVRSLRCASCTACGVRCSHCRRSFCPVVISPRFSP